MHLECIIWTFEIEDENENEKIVGGCFVNSQWKCSGSMAYIDLLRARDSFHEDTPDDQIEDSQENLLEPDVEPGRFSSIRSR